MPAVAARLEFVLQADKIDRHDTNDDMYVWRYCLICNGAFKCCCICLSCAS